MVRRAAGRTVAAVAHVDESGPVKHATLWMIATGLLACGSRTSLPAPDQTTDSAGDGGAAAMGNEGGNGGDGGAGGEAPPPPEPCNGQVLEACGTDLGECRPGQRRCNADGFWGPCEGDIEPQDELCNGLDESCDGVIDDGFGIGDACDGPDSDACLDDVMTCEGCTVGPDLLETCNGIDDNCNGIVDADCDVGGCMPTLLVTGSTPSSPSCIDFPVEPGSSGIIEYPCEGGPVTALLGSILFSGSVEGGQVSLSGSEEIIGPDGCTWRNDHFIDGSIPSGTLQYSYFETLLTDPDFGCWSPCTEVGTVEISWVAL